MLLAGWGSEHAHTPPPLGACEVHLGSAGRSGRVVPVEERATRVKRVPGDWGRKHAVVVSEEEGQKPRRRI